MGKDRISVRVNGSIKTGFSKQAKKDARKQAKKLVPDEFIDLGQGVLEIIEDVHQELDDSKS